MSGIIETRCCITVDDGIIEEHTTSREEVEQLIRDCLIDSYKKHICREWRRVHGGYGWSYFWSTAVRVATTYFIQTTFSDGGGDLYCDEGFIDYTYEYIAGVLLKGKTEGYLKRAITERQRVIQNFGAIVVDDV